MKKKTDIGLLDVGGCGQYIHNGVVLLCHPKYPLLTKEEKEEICNGAGPMGWGLLVPDTMWGLKITEPSNEHDFSYSIGTKGLHKIQADNRYYVNLIRTIEAKTKWRIVKWLRKRRARIYYCAVSKLGEKAFWEGKKRPNQK